MKKVLFLSLALILILGITSHGTSSYLSDTETSTGNTFTAWVEVCEPGSMIIVSDTDTMVTGVNNTPITPQSTVYAWEHTNWGSVSAYFNGLEGPTADWIWETERTDDPAADAPVLGRVVRFERTFEIPCSPRGAELYITVDNGYTVWINGNLVGCAQVNSCGTPSCPNPCIDWWTSDRTEDYVNSHGWEDVKTYTIPASYLIDGTNVLVILATNEYMGPLDDQSNGTWNSNPAGLIYWLEVEWGD
jgi:predicted ribosomally synthesized peptide with SipW-like signal peptide